MIKKKTNKFERLRRNLIVLGNSKYKNHYLFSLTPRDYHHSKEQRNRLKSDEKKLRKQFPEVKHPYFLFINCKRGLLSEDSNFVVSQTANCTKKSHR